MKVAVVTRVLKTTKPIPVVTRVIGRTDVSDIDDLDHYLESEAKITIDNFIKKFPEFNKDNADWSVSIHEVESYG